MSKNAKKEKIFFQTNPAFFFAFFNDANPFIPVLLLVSVPTVYLKKPCTVPVPVPVRYLFGDGNPIGNTGIGPRASCPDRG
jgi:hypothetical protein